MGRLRALLHKAVPAHFADPFGLAARLWRSDSPDAKYAMFNAVATLALTPLDLAMSAAERRLVSANDAMPSPPMLVVCGAARSGTTVVGQTLITSLPVAYVDNFTSFFPRSPLTARKLFRSKQANHRIEPRSHYGRTASRWAPNDGLYLWDRWLGEDRTKVATAISPADVAAMREFWTSYAASLGAPVVAKANRIVAHMELVGSAMPNVTFLVVERDPLYLAQSLLQARRHIHGSDTVPYGLSDPALASTPMSPYASVAQQVAFAIRRATEAEEALGSERVWRIRYESFCADAGPPAQRAADLLGVAVNRDRLEAVAPSLIARTQQTLSDAEFELLRQAVDDICGAQPK